MRNTDNFEVRFMNGSYIQAIEVGEDASTARAINTPRVNADDDVRYEYIPNYWQANVASNSAEASATTFTLTTDWSGETEWEEVHDTAEFARINELYDEVDRWERDRYLLAHDEGVEFVVRPPDAHRVTVDENGNVRINWEMFEPVMPPSEEHQSEESQPDFEDEKGGSLDDFLDSFSGD